MADDNDELNPGRDPCIEDPVSDEDEFANVGSDEDAGDQITDPEDNSGFDEEPPETPPPATSGLATDETITPNREEFGIHHEEYAAGKSVWLFHRHNLIGEPTDEPTYLYGNSKLDPLKRTGIPAHVPGPGGRRMIDSFRYVTGKFWKNNVQTYVPQSMVSIERSRRNNVAFHNPTDVLFHGVEEPAYLDDEDETITPGKPEVKSITDSRYRNIFTNQLTLTKDYDSWTNIEDIITHWAFYDHSTALGLSINYEPLKIRFPFVRTPQRKWHWSNYMYGRPTFNHQMRGVPAQSRPQMQEQINDWEEERRRASSYRWGAGRENDNPNWSSQRQDFSRNLYPVIPFFGPDNIRIPSLDVSSDFWVEPPTKGRNIFFDYSTNFPVLFSERETEDNQLRGAPTVSIKGEYNFYSELYENVVLERFNEKQLPNYYFFRPGPDAAPQGPDQDLVDKFGIIPRGSPVTSSYGDPSKEEYKRIYEADKHLLPMYVDIQLTSVEKSLLAQSLREGEKTMTLDSLFRRLSRRGLAGWKSVTQVVESAEDVQELKISKITSPRLRSLWLGTWMRQWGNREEDQNLHPVEKFRLLFTKQLMKTRVKSIIKRNERTFMDVLRGKPAHSEVIGFKIEKREASSGAVIQINYFATNDQTEIIKFVDSQVKYGKRYKYVVSQVVVVVGTAYAYSNCMAERGLEQFWDPEMGAQRGWQDFFVGVVHTPSARIVEVPIYSKNVVVMDKPPISPNVNVIPFRGEKRKLMFNMDSQTGNFAAKPVVLEPDDVGQFSLVAISQGADPDLEDDVLKSPVEFNNDDPVKIFEVFRVEKEPTSWGSFFQAKVARIESDATAASFLDNITPNKKYWYTFRTEDVHGHVSNPSNIYQIELVSDLDSVYLKSDLFYFRREERKNVLSFKKHVLIEPAFAQKIMELPDDGNFSSWEASPGSAGPLGISQHPVWGKQFKIRITSKSTGKQIDLNFNFTKEYSNMVDR